MGAVSALASRLPSSNCELGRSRHGREVHILSLAGAMPSPTMTGERMAAAREERIGMSRQRTVERDDREAGAQARRQLLADAPVTERRLELAGVSTAVLEGGAGPPVVVGASLGGSLAVRFAAAHRDRLAGLVLVSTGGLVDKVRLRPALLLALIRHGTRPSERTGLAMLRQVSVDVERARRRMGARWEPFRAYSLALARSPGVRAANRRLLRELGLRQVPPEDLAGLAVPTTLIWGRQDRVMPLENAQEAADRYGWALHVIEDAGHFVAIDQPEAFLRALVAALGP